MYAKFNRTAIRIALCIAALGGVSLTHAGYAQLAAPPGFSVSGGGFGYAAAANDQVFGRVIHQPAGLTANVGGQAVKMPAAYRLAANAPRIAAAAIYLHPGIATAVGVASWLMAAALVWDAVNKRWVSQDLEQAQLSDGFEYKISFAGYTWRSDPITACKDMALFYSGPNGYNMPMQFSRYIPAGGVCELKFPDGGLTHVGPLEKRGSACPAGWYVTPAGCTQTPPNKVLTEPDFVEKLAPIPMPSTVPQELPYPTPLPVEQPFINPAPGPDPAHRPQFIPTRDPVRNPNYDPSAAPGPNNSPWIQPGVRMVPSPTPSNPWRVDMQPVDRPVGSAEPNPEPQPDPEPGDGDKPKPEDQQSLCEKHPDILACSKPDLDTPEDEIPRETRDVSYQPESLFGGGVCPSNKTLSTHGMQLTVWDWQEACGYITGYFRPVILVLCAFAAFVIVSGGARQS